MLLFAGSIMVSVYSQQLPLYSQYVQNAFILNPAIAGHDGYTTANLTARRQWIGYKDGPQTYSASFQTRLLKRQRKASGGKLQGGRSGRVGIGGNMFGDINGPISKMGLGFSYAYHIHLDNSQVSFGLSLKTMQIGIDQSKLSLYEDGDPILVNYAKPIYTIDASAGIYWSNLKGFLGLSADQLAESGLKFAESDPNFQMKRQYFLLGGYAFPVGSNYDIEPSFLIKTNEKLFKGSLTGSQADIGARFMMSKMYWLGMFYRTAYGGTFILSMGLRYNQFIFGYAFDYSNKGIANATWGSHEFIMAIKLGDSARRYRWIERY